jgi:hypothetical protein
VLSHAMGGAAERRPACGRKNKKHEPSFSGQKTKNLRSRAFFLTLSATGDWRQLDGRAQRAAGASSSSGGGKGTMAKSVRAPPLAPVHPCMKRQPGQTPLGRPILPRHNQPFTPPKKSSRTGGSQRLDLGAYV